MWNDKPTVEHERQDRYRETVDKHQRRRPVHQRWDQLDTIEAPKRDEWMRTMKTTKRNRTSLQRHETDESKHALIHNSQRDATAFLGVRSLHEAHEFGECCLDQIETIPNFILSGLPDYLLRSRIFLLLRFRRRIRFFFHCKSSRKEIKKRKWLMLARVVNEIVVRRSKNTWMDQTDLMQTQTRQRTVNCCELNQIRMSRKLTNE